MKKRIVVVDVPVSATAEETEQLLGAPLEDGYYLLRLSAGWNDSVGVRALYQLRAKPGRE